MSGASEKVCIGRKAMLQATTSLMADRDALQTSLQRAERIKSERVEVWKGRIAAVESTLSEVTAALNGDAVSDADREVRCKESEFYRLLRRVFIAQMNGDYDLGGKLEQILSEDGNPKTEQEFDMRMEAALKAMVR
jgi:hypothetical protein